MEETFEENSKTICAAGCEFNQTSCAEEKHDAQDIENEVDHRCPFGCHAAGETCNNRYDARTDVTSHREIDTLVERDKPRDSHSDCDGRHDGRGLDDGGYDST